MREGLTNLGVGFGSHDTTSPVPLGLLVLLEVAFLDSGNKLGKVTLVLATDLSQGKHGSGLEKECQRRKSQGKEKNGISVTNLIVNDSSETGFAFDNGIRNTHFPAQGRKEDDQLNGVNIIRDEN